MTSATARANAAHRGRRPDHRAFGAHLDALHAEGAATLDRLRDGRRSGRKLVRLQRLSLDEALGDPVLGVAFLGAVQGAYGSAHGIGPGLVAECFGCRATWAPEARPAAALAVTVLGADADGAGTGLASLLCATCAGLEGERWDAMVLAALARDLGIEDTERVPASAFAAGGRA